MPAATVASTWAAEGQACFSDTKNADCFIRGRRVTDDGSRRLFAQGDAANSAANSTAFPFGWEMIFRL